MDAHTTINEELKELLASFAGGLCGEIHVVPDQYFKHLPAQIIEEIQSIQITQHFSKSSPFTIPEGYFDSLPNLIMETLINIPASEEIELLSPLLSELRDKPTFDLPEQNYFDRLSSDSQKADNVISFPLVPPTVIRKIKWMHWVAAATILCIFSIGGIGYFSGNNHSETSDKDIQSALANIPDAAIQQYLNNNMDAYDLYSSVSEKDINSKISPKEEKMLNSISDEEIEKLLETQIN